MIFPQVQVVIQNLGLSFFCLQKCCVVKSPKYGVHGNSKVYGYIGIENNEENVPRHRG